MGRQRAASIARERIDILLKLALDSVKMDAGYAESYVKLAWRIAERFNLRNKVVLKRYFRCSKCKGFLIPGRTLKIRVLKNKGLGLICLKCGRVKLIPIFMKKDMNQKLS